MLEIILIIIAVLLLGKPIFMNTIGPLIIWKVQKLPANVIFQSIDDDEFIQERSSEFVQYDNSIKNLGFSLVGSSLLLDSHTESYFRLYWNPDIQVAAMAVTMKSNVEEMTYIEFTQKYNDDTVLDVSNSPRPEAYPDLDFKAGYRFPKQKTAQELLETHIKIRNSRHSSLKTVEFDLSRGFGEVEGFIRRESDALLNKGFVKPNIDEEGKRSLTLIGALKLTYRSVPPGKNIFAYITERSAQKALRDV